jgi:hypothetical protein
MWGSEFKLQYGKKKKKKELNGLGCLDVLALTAWVFFWQFAAAGTHHHSHWMIFLLIWNSHPLLSHFWLCKIYKNRQTVFLEQGRSWWIKLAQSWVCCNWKKCSTCKMAFSGGNYCFLGSHSPEGGIESEWVERVSACLFARVGLKRNLGYFPCFIKQGFIGRKLPRGLLYLLL